ncbi:MAG: hypothetical protein RLY50_892 [Actinomycetota bacterium]
MRVLPLPVGAQINVCSRAAMRGQPAACGAVGWGNEDENHSATAGRKESSTERDANSAVRQDIHRDPDIRLIRMPHPGEHHPAFEEYCECIYELHEDNVPVIQARIAERLSVSRPSVSEMVKRMETEGLLRTDGTVITLTDMGLELAVSVVRKHRLAERFLTDILGLSWATAHREAGKWEHVMSDEVETAMVAVLGNPTTCPHGNPIPGSGFVGEAALPLSDVSAGGNFTVARIPETLEFTPGLLDFLETSALLPGNTGTVDSMNSDGSVVVRVDGRSVTVDPHASARLLVVAAR